MTKFHTRLTAGGKPPYGTWTFVVVPPAVHRALGGLARTPVVGTVGGVVVRGTVCKGEGVYRMAVRRDVRHAAGVDVGDRVEVILEIDRVDRTEEIPPELDAVLRSAFLLDAFAKLAPSCRRAWIEHVGGAKRPETRERRAAAAAEAVRARRYPGQSG
ncbi:MAG: DUF1905 domain-containing protein [Planctomycetota bacterium]|nr:DUF1905 domain-containing protein [Planctomycetota bacterium]